MAARTARARTPPAAARTAARAKPRRSTGSPSLLDPIITMNTGGVIQSASESVQEVFGWTPAELFGRNVSVLIP